MKIYANQLQQHLNRALSPVYLIFGDEPLQKMECLDAIRQTAKQQGFLERNQLTVSAQFDWYTLYDAFNSLSLFSNRQVIELELDSGKPGQQGAKALTELINRFNPDTLLIIHGGKIDAGTQKAKWFNNLEKLGLFIPLYNIEGDHLLRWVNQRCKQMSITLSPEGSQLIANFYAGNLLGAAQEIDKLALGYPNQAISIELLQQVILNQSKFTVFALVDALLAGNMTLAIDILISLQLEGIEPNIVNWALIRETLQLFEIKNRLHSGEPQNQIFQQLAIWQNRQGIVQQAIQRLSLNQLGLIITAVNRLDLKLKSFSSRHAYHDLCHICLMFQYADGLQAFELR